MKVLFVRPPRYLWPFNSEASSFWQPLGFAYLAAVLRENGFQDVKILDCPVLKMGWKSLENVLREEKPEVLCIGEETVSAPEGIRLAVLGKALNPQVRIVCGGHFFSFMVEDSLTKYPIDFIVKHEGEQTLLELIQELTKTSADFHKIRGIAFKEGNGVVETPPRDLIRDLDTLPLPAYDLLPMSLYGKGARNHPDLAAIEHSRGCISSCNFCILWMTMGESRGRGGEEAIAPVYRTKSVERSLEEVEVLVKKYHRKTLGWVDSTWNVDPKWSDAFCEGLIKKNFKVQSTKWMRADFVVRDEELGILEKQVRAGMTQAIIGVERVTNQDLKSLDKFNNSTDTTIKAFQIFKNKYPQVFTIASCIYGLRNETKESIDKLVRYINDSGVDYAFVLALTPNPGTRYWKEAKASGLIEVDDFRAYNFHTPIMSSEHLSRRELESIYMKRLFINGVMKPLSILKLLFFKQNERKKTVYRALAKHGVKLVIRMSLGRIKNLVLLKNRNEPVFYSIKPKWYDS